MDITLPAFTPIEESLFLTLCGRALDYRSPHPILSDAMADEIVRKLDCAATSFASARAPSSTSPFGPRNWTRWR